MEASEIFENSELLSKIQQANETFPSSKAGKFVQVKFFCSDLSRAKLMKVNWQGYNLIEVRLREADLSHANLICADLQGCDLKDADLQSALLISAGLNNADLRRANLCSANLTHADLRNANCRDAAIEEANLTGATLSGADLRKTSFWDSQLEKADLTEASLIECCLSFANLSGANLNNANLYRADLKGANLSGANLEKANLTAANLEGADLTNCNLKNANLAECQIRGVKFTGADLEGTILDNQALNHCFWYYGNQYFYNWKGMRFRSSVEVKIAQVLESKGLLYYPNGLARLGSYQRNCETDFLVCVTTNHGFRWAILEVDGYWHFAEKRAKEHERERMFEHLGVRVYRFDAKLCDRDPEAVVNEFIELISK